MNVLTGETGAGKSLIVEAVNLLRGGRASADIPRTGADEAVVEATVEIPADLAARVAGVSRARGFRDGDEEVFIRRVIAARWAQPLLRQRRVDHAGAARRAGRAADRSVGPASAPGPGRCGAPPRDPRCCSASRPAIAAAMLSRGTRCGASMKRCRTLGGDARDREARIDYLRFQLDELDGANLSRRRGRRARARALAAGRGRSAAVGGARAEESLYAGDAARAIGSRRRRARSSAARPIRGSSRSRSSSARSSR